MIELSHEMARYIGYMVQLTHLRLVSEEPLSQEDEALFSTKLDDVFLEMTEHERRIVEELFSSSLRSENLKEYIDRMIKIARNDEREKVLALCKEHGYVSASMIKEKMR